LKYVYSRMLSNVKGSDWKGQPGWKQQTNEADKKGRKTDPGHETDADVRLWIETLRLHLLGNNKSGLEDGIALKWLMLYEGALRK
jgi:hypothetical protein